MPSFYLKIDPKVIPSLQQGLYQNIKLSNSTLIFSMREKPNKIIKNSENQRCECLAQDDYFCIFIRAEMP